MAEGSNGRLVGQYTAPRDVLDEYAHGENEEEDILMSQQGKAQIANRESDYQKRRFNRKLDERDGESVSETMKRREIEAEEERVMKLLEERRAQREEEEDAMDGVVQAKPLLKDGSDKEDMADGAVTTEQPRKRRRRWDTTGDEAAVVKAEEEEKPPVKKSKWDTIGDTATAVAKPSRFDRAPEAGGASASNPAATPARALAPITGFGTDVSSRNAPLSDEELDMMLPGEKEGYKILPFPPGYEPLRAPAHRVSSTPASLSGGFMMQESVDARAMLKDLPNDVAGVGDLRMKPEDMAYFGKLVDGADENEMTVDELKERKIMRLLIKVKNGTPPMRKTALRQLTDNARAFGAGPLFDQILPLLMEKTLEDQERHLLVKVIDRILYKLDDLVRPYTHKILVVIEPLLIDQDYYARVEGKEIISNLAKAAGLAHMISTMRPDIDHADEYVRNTTARAFAVVASALGIPALLPFLRAVCRSKKSWQARHTGIKIIQQIPIQMGCAILPHLKGLVDCISDNIQDEQVKVRSVTALAISALAEASNPYGIESFEEVLNPLWQGSRYVIFVSYPTYTFLLTHLIGNSAARVLQHSSRPSEH